MKEVAIEKKVIAKMVAKAFGGQPKVIRYWDEKDENCIDILSCIDQPQKGITSYSTIGVSDYSNIIDSKNVDIRIELVGICSNTIEFFPNILSTAAFCIINSKWSGFPDAIFPNVIGMYDKSITMHHLLFTDPFIWDDTLETLKFGDKRVAWLLLVPISDAELRYAETEGVDKLQKLLADNQVDISDINRVSVV